MSFVDHLYGMKIGGSKDTAALSCLGAAMLTSSPVLAHLPNAIPASLACIGSSYLTWRYGKYFLDRDYLSSELDFNSSVPPSEITDVSDGFLIGYTTDTGQPIILPMDDIMRHTFVLGQSGVGKTVLLRLFMAQQMQRGGGLLFVDGKQNRGDQEDFYHLACMYGRQDDIIFVTPGAPERSNTYNMILYGDPDEIANRIVQMIPSTEAQAGADYYKQASFQGLTTIISALQAANLAYNMIDLCVLLMNPRALEELLTKVNNRAPGSDAAKSLEIFIDQFRIAGGAIDIKKLKDVFGGIGGRLYAFGTGKFGQICNTYDPDLKLFEAIRQNKIIYVGLPTMSKDIAASNFAKMLVGDLRSAVDWIQNLPEDEKPNPAFMLCFDEAGSYVNDAWSRIFEQIRSSRLFCIPAAQTTANFKAISDELYEMVCGNTWNKIIFSVGSQETAEAAAELIGYHMTVVRALADSQNTNISSPIVAMTPEGGTGAAAGTSYTEREQEDYRVSADQLKELDKGQAVLFWGGKYLYDIRVPMIKVDRKWAKKFGPIRINRSRERKVIGADFYKNSERYLTKNDVRFMASKPKNTGANDD